MKGPLKKNLIYFTHCSRLFHVFPKKLTKNDDNDNFEGECLRQHYTKKSLRQWDYMLQTKKVSDWIIWCNIFWHPALFSPELISPEGSHHKPCLSGQIYSRETTFPDSKEELRKCVWHCQNNIFSLVHAKAELSSELSIVELENIIFLTSLAWQHHTPDCSSAYRSTKII